MTQSEAGRPVKVAVWSELKDREPTYALVGAVDLS